MDQHGVDCQTPDPAQEQRVAIGSGLGCGLGTDDTTGAWSVIDNNLLAQRARELLCDDAGNRVIAASGGEGHNQSDGFGRVVLCANWNANTNQHKHRQATQAPDDRSRQVSEHFPEALPENQSHLS